MKELLKNKIPNELLSPSEEFLFAMSLMDMQWWYWDHRERQLFLSPELKKLLGYSEEEYDSRVPTIGKNIHPDDLDKSLNEFKRLIKGETSFYESEYRLKVKDEWQWFYNRGGVLSRDNQGIPVLIGGITMNISTRYRRMLSKAEDESKSDFIFRHTTEPVIIGRILLDEERSVVTEANNAAGRLFECKAEDLIGCDPYELIKVEGQDARRTLSGKLNEAGRLTFFSEFQVSKGETKYVDVKVHLLPMIKNDMFIAVLSDKTESYMVKKELQQSEEALRESERIYRELIQSADDRIALYDLEGSLLVVNNAFTETLGFAPGEYDGLKEFDRVHPDDKDYLLSLRRQDAESGTLSTQYRIQHKDGHYLTMSSKSVLIKDEELKKEYVLFIIRDISESVDFQKELIEAKEKAVESDLLKSAFLANMSHEIRTPMNSIIGFANLLSNGDLDEHSRQEYVSRINRNSEQLLALISDIIDLAKIESNQLSISYSKVLLDSLFSELMNYGEMQLKNRKKTELKLIFEPDVNYLNIEIETDLIRITQILQNLLNNAVKFTQDGDIRLGYTIQDKKIVFFVKDTGLGIDTKNFNVIFDQFRQVDGSHTRRFGGTGLGLAICRNLSGLLGGRIWVESKKGVGSSFFVELPLIGAKGIEPVHMEDPPAHTEPKTEMTIMLVDDDPDSLMLVSTILKHEGICVVTAESGYRALEYLDRGIEPDVLLLDLEMPVLNGQLTYKLVKELYPELIVVAQSAHALEGERQKSLDLGFNEYLAKPYSKDDLLKVLRKVMN